MCRLVSYFISTYLKSLVKGGFGNKQINLKSLVEGQYGRE